MDSEAKWGILFWVGLIGLTSLVALLKLNFVVLFVICLVMMALGVSHSLYCKDWTGAFEIFVGTVILIFVLSAIYNILGNDTGADFGSWIYKPPY